MKTLYSLLIICLVTTVSFAAAPDDNSKKLDAYLQQVRQTEFGKQYVDMQAALFSKLMSGEIFSDAGLVMDQNAEPGKKMFHRKDNGEEVAVEEAMKEIGKSTAQKYRAFYLEHQGQYKTDYPNLKTINENFREDVQPSFMIPTPKIGADGNIDVDDLNKALRIREN
jgi:hypothetical protein